MKDEHQGTALYCPCRGEMHRQTHGNDYWRAARTAYLCATVRGLDTSFPCQRIPSLGTRMDMRRRCHTWREDRFHILRGILFACDDGKWADFGRGHVPIRQRNTGAEQAAEEYLVL